MKRLFSTMALLVFAASVGFAQPASDYAGKWSLDVKASELDQRSMVESMTLTVSATEKDISVTTESVRQQRQGQGGAGGQGGRGQGMGPGLMPGDGTVKYNLDGKAVKDTQEMQMGNIELTLTGKASATGLSLVTERKMSSPVGEISLKTSENWSLSDGGKTLTIKREMDTPRGKMNSVLVFRKE